MTLPLLVRPGSAWLSAAEQSPCKSCVVFITLPPPSLVCFPKPMCNHVSSVWTLLGGKDLFSPGTWSESRTWSGMSVLCPVPAHEPKDAAAASTSLLPASFTSLCGFKSLSSPLALIPCLHQILHLHSTASSLGTLFLFHVAWFLPPHRSLTLEATCFRCKATTWLSCPHGTKTCVVLRCFCCRS